MHLVVGITRLSLRELIWNVSEIQINLCKPQAIHLPHFITVNQTWNVKLLKKGKNQKLKGQHFNAQKSLVCLFMVLLSKRTYASRSKSFQRKHIMSYK